MRCMKIFLLLGGMWLGGATAAQAQMQQQVELAPVPTIDSSSQSPKTDTKSVLRARLLRLLVDSTQANKGVAATDWGNFPKQEPSRLRSLNVNGFYRFFGTYRNMPGDYAFVTGGTLPQREIFIGDDTQLPNLMFNISGKSRPGMSWGMDIFAFQFLDRPGLAAYSPSTPDTSRPNIDRPLQSPRLGQSLLLNLGLNLYSTIQTSLGPLSIKLGGIHWVQMTDLTMGAYTAYERYMLFDRNPWDPIGANVFERYNRYVDQGQVDQEERWGQRAFAGLVVDMAQLPHNQSLKVMFGKNEQNGGFDLRPNTAYGGQYAYAPNAEWKLSLQTMNQLAYQDNQLLKPFGSMIHTLKVDHHLSKLHWQLETGYSGYQSEQTGQIGGWLAQAKYDYRFNKTWKLFGQAYAIDPSAVNNVGAFVNTSVSEATTTDIPAGQAGSGALLFPTNSSLLGFGQLANNRLGFDANLSFKPTNIHFTLGYSLSREINTGATSLSFGRPVNALTRSRFWRWGFPQNVGPYGRTNLLYRNTFDKVAFTDTLQSHLHFSQIEFQALYRVRVWDKVLVFNHFLRTQSVQDAASFLNTSPQAILRQYASENELYLQWNDRFTLVFLGSADVTLGGVLTGVNAIGRPLEQYGSAYGFGFDIWAADNVCLYFRQRYFDFEDRSFTLDTYRGVESTLELKLIF